MILDYNYLFDGSASAAGGVVGVTMLGSVASVTNSTNIIDLVNARDMGDGDSPALKIMCLVTSTFTSTGAATFQVKAQASTDNTTYVTYAETPAIATSGLVAGTKIANFDWPGISPDGGALLSSLPRYLRLTYTTGTSNFSTGAVISAIVLGRDESPNRAYPPGVTVSN